MAAQIATPRGNRHLQAIFQPARNVSTLAIAAWLLSNVPPVIPSRNKRQQSLKEEAWCAFLLVRHFVGGNVSFTTVRAPNNVSLITVEVHDTKVSDTFATSAAKRGTVSCLWQYRSRFS
mmetsp:Transcript_19857/g.40857  ORF Transcript_19857/g.40857 Transcript_19857/m.40857 type:complete len:119 (+) Transcript_19857:165-521(+)